MKNLNERIKDFFTAFWTWLTYSRVPFRFTEEYVNGYEDFLTEYCKERDYDKNAYRFSFDGDTGARIFYDIKCRKKKRSSRKILRQKMYLAFFEMIFFWLSRKIDKM